MREALRSPGLPLDIETRSRMETRFGHDFSAVRVHADSRSAESAEALDALAYTVGQEVVFGAGRYSPGTSVGMRLLAHELTHVVQQRHAASSDSSPLLLDSGDSAAEQEARAVAGGSRQDASTRVTPISAHTPFLQRAGFGEVRETESDLEAESAMPSIQVGDSISVLWFEFNSTDLRQDKEVDSVTHLAMALSRIRNHEAEAGEYQKIIIHGYASKEGEEQHNVDLSTRRAERVRQLLVDAGVPAERISTLGHGPNDEMEGLAWNRRVEIELQPTVTRIEMPGETITAVRCACGADTQKDFDEETFRFIASIAPTISEVAARRGVPPHAVAGAIAEEYNTRRGLRTVVDGLQDVMVDLTPETAIDIHRFFDIHSKLLNTLQHDIGPANVKVRTALELVQEGELEVPGSPSTDIQVKKIVDYLLTETGTVEASAAVIAKGQGLFGAHMTQYDEGFQEAVLVEYFNQGDSYYDRFKAALDADPGHTPCPGDDGCEFLHNHDRIEQALSGASENKE